MKSKSDKQIDLHEDQGRRPGLHELLPPVKDIVLDFFGAELNIIHSGLFIADKRLASKIALSQHTEYLNAIRENKKLAQEDPNFENQFFNAHGIEVTREIKAGETVTLTGETFIIPDPALGYPNAFDWLVLRNIEELASRHLVRDGVIPEWLEFRMKPFAIQVYGREDVGGSDIRNIETSLMKFRRTRIKSKWMWKVKETGDWTSTSDSGITIFNRVVAAKKRVRSEDNRDGNWLILLDPLYRKSLNDHYYLIYDKETFAQLGERSDLARLLYERFYLQFMRMKSSQARVLKSYADLCTSLQLTQQKHLSSARRQLAAAMEELLEMGLFAKWGVYSNNTGEFIIEAWPGPLFKKLQVKLAGKTLADLEIQDLSRHMPNQQLSLAQTSSIVMPEPMQTQQESGLQKLTHSIARLAGIDYRRAEALVKPLEDDYTASIQAAQAGTEYIEQQEQLGRPVSRVRVWAKAFHERWTPNAATRDQSQNKTNDMEAIVARIKSLAEQNAKKMEMQRFKDGDMLVLKDHHFKWKKSKLLLHPTSAGTLYFFKPKSGRQEVPYKKMSETEFIKRLVFTGVTTS